MKKWYDEEYEFTIEVTGFLHAETAKKSVTNTPVLMAVQWTKQAKVFVPK